MVMEYPELRTLCDGRIELFLSNKSARSKRSVPSLGEFVTLLAVSDRYTWDDIVFAYVGEVFDRNIKWALEEFPVLADTEMKQEMRARLTFEANAVSLRLLMFHAFFSRMARYVCKLCGSSSSCR